jgi:antitoxin PrlF
MNARAKITSKGQITLPKKLRDEMYLQVGDMIDFARMDNGSYVISHSAANHAMHDNFIGYDGPPLSGDEIVELLRRSREGTGDEFLAEIRKAKRA